MLKTIFKNNVIRYVGNSAKSVLTSAMSYTNFLRNGVDRKTFWTAG